MRQSPNGRGDTTLVTGTFSSYFRFYPPVWRSGLPSFGPNRSKNRSRSNCLNGGLGSSGSAMIREIPARSFLVCKRSASFCMLAVMHGNSLIVLSRRLRSSSARPNDSGSGAMPRKPSFGFSLLKVTERVVGDIRLTVHSSSRMMVAPHCCSFASSFPRTHPPRPFIFIACMLRPETRKLKPET